MATVDTVGVRWRLWILAKALGMALYTDIDRVVRAVGRIVVWVEAAAELSTIRRSRWYRKFPKLDVPKTEWPMTEMTSLSLFGFPSPMPVVPRPAYDSTRHHHQHVGDQEDQRREHGSLARASAGSPLSPR